MTKETQSERDRRKKQQQPHPSSGLDFAAARERERDTKVDNMLQYKQEHKYKNDLYYENQQKHPLLEPIYIYI